MQHSESHEPRGFDADSFGRLVSLNVLVAMALAEGFKADPDPRASAYLMISAVEEQLAETMAKFRPLMPPDQCDRMEDAARHNVMAVGAMTDTFLRQLGAEPRSSD